MQKEIFMTIDISPLYEVSNKGRIRGWNNKGWGKRKVPKILKQTPNKKGYLIVNLHNSGNSCVKLVHVLVLTYFRSPKPSEKHQCRHLDGNNQNNNDWNLVWGTSQENAADRKRHGTIARGSRQGKAKLKESDIPKIRKLRKEGFTYKRISHDYPVSQNALRDIIIGDTWIHVS